MTEKCENCGNEIGEKFIEKGGKKFCSADCMKKYEEAHPAEDKDNTCEFC